MAKYVVRPELLDALMMAESGGNPNAVSPKGARGAFQIMPRTARDPGFGIMPLRDNSPEEQRRFAHDYLGELLDRVNGDEALAIAAYNSGLGNVQKYGGIPPFRETQGHVAKIGRLLNPISSAQAEDTPVVTPDSPMQYGNRPDGTKKGYGYLGELKRSDGNVMTEYSVGVPINGKQMDIPTLVPTLTPDEVNQILNLKEGEFPSKEIIGKAVRFAEQRVKNGLPVFAGPDDYPKSPMQYPAQDDFDKVWEQAQQTQPAQAEQADPFDQVWEQAQQQQPKEPDTGYALPNFLSGLGSSVLNQAGALAQIPSAALKKLGVMDQQSAYDNVPEWLLSEAQKGKQDAPGFSGGAGKFVGDVLPFLAAPTAAFQPGLVGKILPTIENALTQGGLATALTPGSGRDRAAAGAGAGLGAAVFPAVTGGISSLIKGFDPSDAGKALQDLGVVPTVGQGIDKIGKLGQIISRWEEASASKPILGDFIRDARSRAGSEGIDAIVNKNVGLPYKTLATKRQEAGKVINELRTYGIVPQGSNMQNKIGNMADQLSKSYDTLYKGFKIKANNLTDYVDDTIKSNNYGLSDTQVSALQAQIKNAFGNKVKDGFIDGHNLKFIDSDIRKLANEYKKSNLVSEKMMGRALDDASLFINDYVKTYLPASVSKAVKEVDSRFGAFKLIEDAASTARAARNGGEFTPNELMAAIRRDSIKTGGKGRFARGEARMQRDAENLSRLFTDTLPNSGTFDRMAWSDLVKPSFIPNALMGFVGGIGSTRPVQKALLGGYDFQRPTSLFIDKYITPRMAPGAAGLGYYLYDQSR